MPEFVPPTGMAFRMLWAGSTTIDRTWEGQLRDPFWRLYRNADDGCEVAWAGGRLPLPAGRVALIPAWTRCRGHCRGSVRHLFVHFVPAQEPGPGRPVLLPELPGLAALAEAVAGGADGSPGWWMRVAALVSLAMSAQAGAAEPRPAGVGRLYPALALIEASPAAHLAVATLARSCGLGADRFARLFRSCLGCAPAAWVRQRRIIAAVEQLRTGDSPIDEIATACGFANRFHFTRVFTAHTGRPPAAYRRQGR